MNEIRSLFLEKKINWGKKFPETKDYSRNTQPILGKIAHAQLQIHTLITMPSVKEIALLVSEEFSKQIFIKQKKNPQNKDNSKITKNRTKII